MPCHFKWRQIISGHWDWVLAQNFEAVLAVIVKLSGEFIFCLPGCIEAHSKTLKTWTSTKSWQMHVPKIRDAPLLRKKECLCKWDTSLEAWKSWNRQIVTRSTEHPMLFGLLSPGTGCRRRKGWLQDETSRKHWKSIGHLDTLLKVTMPCACEFTVIRRPPWASSVTEHPPKPGILPIPTCNDSNQSQPPSLQPTGLQASDTAFWDWSNLPLGATSPVPQPATGRHRTPQADKHPCPRSS